jgi:alkylation response protein AidB-like acyl-CoA dehydrogenase
LIERRADEVKTLLELRRIAGERGDRLPKPGSGGTPTRFDALADWAARDLSFARLAEGHVDALAILAEAGEEADPGVVYGVWAARQSIAGTTAFPAADGWHLAGTKSFCSGSTRIDRALVTAECEDGYRLFDICVAENVESVHAGSWPAVGMADSLSETLEFGGPPIPRSRAIGPPNFYLERPGFWFGATGVAACWYGGSRGLVEHVLRNVDSHPSESVEAELGHAIAHLDLMRTTLQSAAREIDADPEDRLQSAKRRALLTRHAVHHAAQQILVHAAAAGGARPLCLHAEQARRAADLYVYLAQHHGPQDAGVLGRMAREEWPLCSSTKTSGAP